jgi:hypothetical protein
MKSQTMGIHLNMVEIQKMTVTQSRMRTMNLKATRTRHKQSTRLRTANPKSFWARIAIKKWKMNMESMNLDRTEYHIDTGSTSQYVLLVCCV